MAVPKKKVSKSRRNMRRFASGNQMEKVTLIHCPSCNEPTRPHRVCQCGFYKSREVVAQSLRAQS